MLLQLITLLGALAMFLYGMSLMSNGLQKLTSKATRRMSDLMVKGRFQQILAGFGITSAVQSSSATKLMVVTSVSAGMLTLSQSVGVIMGANIGTTVTPWLITLLGITLNFESLSFIILGIGFIFSMSKKPTYRSIGELVIGISLIFLGLLYIQKCMTALNEETGVAYFAAVWTSHGFWSCLISLGIGILLSMILQSSAATVVLATVAYGMGWMPFNLGLAMVLGANLGTTLNIQLAASSAPSTARRASLIYLLFNGFGLLIFLIFFNPFVDLTGAMISLFWGVNPAVEEFVAGTEPASSAGMYGICLGHTLFNIIVTLILVWFADKLEDIVTKLVKDDDGDKASRLKFIRHGTVSTPSISISQAIGEVINFGEICKEGFAFVPLALHEQDPGKFEEYRMKLVSYEELTDKMEAEIASFLNEVTSSSELSITEAEEIKVIYRVIGEMESLGDSEENCSRILERERVHNHKFDDDHIRKIDMLIAKVNTAFEVMNANLHAAANGSLVSISNAYQAEDNINKLRSELRQESVDQIEKRSGNYQSVNYFLDMINELEAMGDFMINISQAIVRNDG
jgi:phosphate:Na+ symporter